MHRRVLSALVALAVMAGLVSARTPPAPSDGTASAAGVTIPFDLVDKHVMLEVTVNKSQPLSFVLDTGDKFAVIDLDRAKELGLRFAGEVAVGGAGSKKDTGAFVKDAAFTISGFAGFSQPVTLAIPLRKMSSRFGHDFDGIIGADFIKDFVLELDYQARVIRLHDKDKFTYSGPGQNLPIRLTPMGHLVIEAEVTPIGSTPIKGQFVVDIGSGAALTLHSPFVAQHHLPGPAVKTVKAHGHGGTGGEVIGKIGRVAELRIGTFKFSNPNTLFSEDKAGAFADSAIQGNLGEQIMSRFKLFLDYRHDRMILEPNETFAAAFDRADSGLVIEALGSDYKTFRIKEVLENSPASEAGLLENDTIMAVNGQAASDLTLSKISELFERPVSYNLIVRRVDRTLNVTLTPRQLA